MFERLKCSFTSFHGSMKFHEVSQLIVTLGEKFYYKWLQTVFYLCNSSFLLLSLLLFRFSSPVTLISVALAPGKIDLPLTLDPRENPVTFTVSLFGPFASLYMKWHMTLLRGKRISPCEMFFRPKTQWTK